MEQIPIEKENFLGDRMRDLRLYFGFKQSDIAEALNVCRSTYSYYEEGKTRPDPAVLGKLSRYYDIPIDVFFKENLDMDIPLHDSGIRRRTSRSASFDIQKVGDLRPAERSLILFLRANDMISAKDVLESLEYQLEKEREAAKQRKETSSSGEK